MDPIANMLSQVKNAQAVRKEKVELPHSKAKEALAHLLEKEGYLTSVRTFKPKGRFYKSLVLGLRYFEGEPFIGYLKRVSKPGQRIYVGKDALPFVLRGRGLVVISTSRGLMSAKEAKKRGLGGEVICKVW